MSEDTGIVGIQRDDGTVAFVGVYHAHRLGPLLAARYPDRARAQRLLDLGDLSYVGLTLGRKHAFSSPAEYVGHYATQCLAYHRDDGRPYRAPRVARSVGELVGSGGEYGETWMFVLGVDERWRYRRYSWSRWKNVVAAPLV